jgi:hypothetical protein
MEIKYDASGQPLPENQQDWAKEAAHAKQAESITPADQIATKEFKTKESPDSDDVDDVQLQNPFVAEYRRKQKELNADVEAAPAEEDEAEEVAPEPIVPVRDNKTNFKNLRAQAERAERERDEAIRALRDREYRDNQLARQAQPEAEVDDLDITDDGFVEPKHIKKVLQVAKQARKELAEYKQKSAKEMQEMMLYRQFPDIANVVSDENIEILKEIKPAYARQLAAMHAAGDIYGTGELAYNYMIDLGIHMPKNSAKAKDYSADKIRAHNNAAKPKPLVSGGTAKSDSPISKAHAYSGELTEADMRANYLAMEAAIRNRGD